MFIGAFIGTVAIVSTIGIIAIIAPHAVGLRMNKKEISLRSIGIYSSES